MKKYYLRYKENERFDLYFDGEKIKIDHDIVSNFQFGYAEVMCRGRIHLLNEHTGKTHSICSQSNNIYASLYEQPCLLCVSPNTKKTIIDIYAMMQYDIQYIKSISIPNGFYPIAEEDTPQNILSKYVRFQKKKSTFIMDIETEEILYRRSTTQYHPVSDFVCGVFAEISMVSKFSDELGGIDILDAIIENGKTKYYREKYKKSDYMPVDFNHRNFLNRNSTAVIYIPKQVLLEYKHIFFGSYSQYLLPSTDGFYVLSQNDIARHILPSPKYICDRTVISSWYNSRPSAWISKAYRIENMHQPAEEIDWAHTKGIERVHVVSGNLLMVRQEYGGRGSAYIYFGTLYDKSLSLIMREFRFEYANSEYIAIRKEDGGLLYIDGFGNKI